MARTLVAELRNTAICPGSKECKVGDKTVCFATLKKTVFCSAINGW
jgi:hypothetical protein